MRVQLLRACALLAVAGSALAADKPKEKHLPQTSMREVYKAEGRAEAQAESTNGFTITKPVGTWVRDVQMKEGAVRVRLTITDDRVTLKAELTDGNNVATVQFDADYAINKESCLFGVLDTFSTDQALSGQVGNLTSMSGQPFAVRFRADEKTLSIKEFKGFGVGLTESTDDNVKKMLLAVCGQYAAVDPAKPLPELKANASGQSRLDRVPYPTPHYLKHYPTYFAPDPPFPQDKERDKPLDPTGELKQAKAEAVVSLVPSRCEEPPTDAEVMTEFLARRAKELGKGWELSRDDDGVTIVKHLVKDKVEPVREYPVMGKAQLHHCRWECGVYYTNTTGGGKKSAVEVICLETDCLRVVPVKDAVVPARMPER